MAEEKKKSAVQQEMERRSNDLLRVYNPTDTDYVTQWDRKNGAKLFRVPKKEETVLVRYIAEKYIREMYMKIVTDKTDQAVLEENEKRINKGMAEMTKWKDQSIFDSKFYNPTDDEARRIIATLYVGVESEFGVDREIEDSKPEVADNRPTLTRALEDVQTARDEGREIEGEDRKEEESMGGTFKCDYPGCDFSTETKVALFGHKRSHRDNVDKKKQALAGVSA